MLPSRDVLGVVLLLACVRDWLAPPASTVSLTIQQSGAEVTALTSKTLLFPLSQKLEKNLSVRCLFLFCSSCYLPFFRFSHFRIFQNYLHVADDVFNLCLFFVLFCFVSMHNIQFQPTKFGFESFPESKCGSFHLWVAHIAFIHHFLVHQSYIVI